MTHVNPSLEQASFRGRNDDGSETAATWIEAANTNWTQAVDTPFRIRFLIKETAGGTENNGTLQLQYNLNGAGWNSVNGTSSVVQSALSTHFADDDNTTQQLGTGTFITPNSGMDEDNGLAGENNDIDFAGNDEVEIEYCQQILSADVAHLDSIQFRVVRSDLTVLETYTNTPTVTVSESQTFTGTGNLSIPVISMSAAGSMLEPEGQAALLLEDAALDSQGEQDVHGVAALDMTLYTTTASKYDGTNDYATRGADLTGNTNSFGVLVSVFVNIDAAGEGTVRTIYGAEGERVHLYLDANDKIVWELWDGSSQIVLLTSTNTYTSADGWFCIMANYRVVSGTDKDSWIYVNDTQEAHNDVFTANGIDCTRTDHAVGAKTTGVDLFAGDLSELFIHFSSTDARVLLTDVKERRKFVNSKGRATPKGDDGSEVLGAIPLVYAPDGDPSDNKGSGGNFAITGALEMSVTSPAEGPEAAGLAGSGTHTEGGTGTGDLSLAVAALEAIGEQPHEGVGDLPLAVASLDAEGVMLPEGVGDIALADELLSSQGRQTFEGAGDIIAQQAVLDAAGALQPEATADIGLDESILTAEGSTGEATGSASLVLSEGTLQAEGHEHPKGSATLTLNAASLTAAGIETIPGSAVLLLADSELVGTALMQPEGGATISLSDALLTAEGVHGAPQGTGNLLIDQMVLEAQGEQPHEGAGNLMVEQAVLEGQGVLLPDGTSAIKLERVVLTTQGSGGGAAQVFEWYIRARRRGRR